MNTKSVLSKINLTIFIFIAAVLYSQKRTEDFSISFPESKASKSYYKTIKLIDSRIDSTSLGIVQKGAFNAKAKVIPSSSLSEQFQTLLNHINGENAEDGTLILYLKQLSFAEVTGAFSEHGYCYFQAFLFSKNEDGTYSYLDKIDSVIDHSSLDVTKATMRKGSEMVSNFISKNIAHKGPQTEHYTFTDLKNYDDIEKQKINLYTFSELKDGVYNSYESFKNQEPDQPLANIKFYDKLNSKVTRIYENVDGKEKEIKKGDRYAIIHQGIPYFYVSLDNAFSKAEKREGDFYFVGKNKTTAKTGDVIMASAFFGIIGGLIASGPASLPFEMKIDYLNGGFIPIKEVKK